MNNENFELENMRTQMNTLKKKLEKQEIVNERFIRHSMENTAGKISRRYYGIMALCLLMIPYSYWAFVKLRSLFQRTLLGWMHWRCHRSHLGILPPLQDPASVSGDHRPDRRHHC